MLLGTFILEVTLHYITLAPDTLQDYVQLGKLSININTFNPFFSSHFDTVFHVNHAFGEAYTSRICTSLFL